ncbi:MAG TPA: helix-turn-helix domain-containing protein, partial [Polyangiaceae bacterium]|nr:helix-turn-helix domain-containing protein [Polyangiaceae bacterium]
MALAREKRFAAQLQALGHPVRLKIVRFHARRGAQGATAGELQGHLELPASTLSHHLKKMVAAGVLSTHGEGTFHVYVAN